VRHHYTLLNRTFTAGNALQNLQALLLGLEALGINEIGRRSPVLRDQARGFSFPDFCD